MVDKAVPPLRNNTDPVVDEFVKLERQQNNRELIAICGDHLQTHGKEEVSQIHLTLRNPSGRSWPQKILPFPLDTEPITRTQFDDQMAIKANRAILMALEHFKDLVSPETVDGDI